MHTVPFLILPYIGIAFSLVAAGSFVPFPEEAILLSLGYAVSTHLLHLWPALLVAILSVIAGDNMLFFFAKKGGTFADHLYARITNSRAGVLVNRGDRYPGYMVCVTRFIIGLRTLGPFIAVNRGMHWWRFFLWDVFAATLFVVTWFSLGFHFHHSFLRFVRDFELLRGMVFMLIVLAVALFGWWFTYGGKRSQ